MNPYWIYPQTQLQPVPQYAQQYQPQWQPQPQFQPQNYVQPALLQQPQQLQITGQSVPIMEASVAQSVKSTTTNKPKRPNSRKNQGVVQRQGRRPNRPRNSAAAELKRLQIRMNKIQTHLNRYNPSAPTAEDVVQQTPTVTNAPTERESVPTPILPIETAPIQPIPIETVPTHPKSSPWWWPFH